MGLQHKTPTLDSAFDVFIFDQKARGHTKQTVNFYRWTLRPFIEFLNGQGIARLADVTPNHIRHYLTDMRERNLSGYTIHGAARSLRAFFQFLRTGGILGGQPHEQN